MHDANRQAPKMPLKLLVMTNVVALISAGIAIALTYVGVFPFQSELGLYRILPGDILIDFAWIWVIAGLVGLIIYSLAPHIARIFLWAHRITSGGNYDYHLQRIERKGDSGTMRGLLLPSFIALGLTFTLINISEEIASIFVLESFDTLPSGVREPLSNSMPLFFLLLLVAGCISLLIAPAWLLEDAGVICVRKDKERTADIQGVGNWYLSILKGFAGISTLLAYLFVSWDMIVWFQLLPSYTVEVPIVMFLVPVIVVIISPLIALAPITFSYSFYILGLERNMQKMREAIQDDNYQQVTVNISTHT